MSGAWNLVVSFGRPFGGEEIERDPRLVIRVPFANQDSARQALGEVTLAVERGEPEVIQGQVVAEHRAIASAVGRPGNDLLDWLREAADEIAMEIGDPFAETLATWESTIAFMDRHVRDVDRDNLALAKSELERLGFLRAS